MYTKFIKNVNGIPVIKNRNAISVITKKQVTNPTTKEIETHEFRVFGPSDELLLADGWERYVESPIEKITEQEETIESVKIKKFAEIEKYDSSNEVNIFYIQDMPIWLDKATRAGLKLRFESEAAMGFENTSLWYDNLKVTLPVKDAIGMLYALEVYASQCYDNTQFHLANVNKLETVEDVLFYNFRTGYPEKLHF